MRLRLSQSERLVDLGGVADLKGIRADGNGVVIGAMATHAAVAANADVRRAAPALAELAAGIGDPMVRNMGTLGGSIANADPAACYPAGVVGLNATIHTDRRTIPADDFFTGLYETALQPGELITEVSFPAAQRAAYVKYKQLASRFALIGVFVAQTGKASALPSPARRARCFVPRRSRTRWRRALPRKPPRREDADHRHQRRPARLGRVPRRHDQRHGIAGRGVAA
jgi:CO/xanthine dehydrogenase FAD-binding subunit